MNCGGNTTNEYIGGKNWHIGDAPFVLQDFPLVTTVQMSVPVIRRIVNEHPTCVCLKHEDWPGLDKITALRAEGRTAPRILVLTTYSGDVQAVRALKAGATGYLLKSRRN